MTEREPNLPLAQLALLPHLTADELEELRVALNLRIADLAAHKTRIDVSEHQSDYKAALSASYSHRGRICASLLTAVLEAQGSLR